MKSEMLVAVIVGLLIMALCLVIFIHPEYWTDVSEARARRHAVIFKYILLILWNKPVAIFGLIFSFVSIVGAIHELLEENFPPKESWIMSGLMALVLSIITVAFVAYRSSQSSDNRASDAGTPASPEETTTTCSSFVDRLSPVLKREEAVVDIYEVGPSNLVPQGYCDLVARGVRVKLKVLSDLKGAGHATYSCATTFKPFIQNTYHYCLQSSTSNETPYAKDFQRVRGSCVCQKPAPKRPRDY